jgi:hypothetical protein
MFAGVVTKLIPSRKIYYRKEPEMRSDVTMSIRQSTESSMSLETQKVGTKCS